MLILDGYDSHLTYQFIQYCELNKIIILQLPAHSTHFLQSFDIVIFQQWKHWHAETIDRHIRQGAGGFNHQTFLANLEDIRRLTLTTGNIKSAFRRCGIAPFLPDRVLRILPAPISEPSSASMLVSESALPALPALPMEWEPLRTHKEIQLQAETI